MLNINEKYVTEEYNNEGELIKFEVNCPDDYNFAYDIIDEIGRQTPDKKAIIWVGNDGSEKIFTYADLAKESNKAANMFLAHGVKKGDKVICVLKRHYQFWIITCALCKIGAVIIPATNQLKKKDYVYRFNAAEVDYIVATADGDVTDNVELALNDYKLPGEKFIVNGNKDGWLNFDDECAKYPDTLERIKGSAYDDMLLYFTSGTTAYPKMVVHNQTYSLAHIITAKHWHHLDDHSLHLTVSETGWAKCMWGKMYGQLIMESCLFIYDFDRFNAHDLLVKLENYKVNSFCAPPTIYRFLVKEGIENYDFSCLEYATTAGEALNFEVYKRFHDYTGIKLMEGFGQTETVLLVGNLFGAKTKPGSMGRPVPLFDIELINEDGKPCEVGEAGEICVKMNGKHPIGVFDRYYNDPEATATAFRDGYYHTCDTAYKDEDGFFWYVGRTDDVIKSSGYRISPFEIESVLMEHPAVLECAVTGVKDEIRGIAVKATIILTSEYKNKADDALKKDIQDYVKKNTAPYKYPRVIEFVDELPKTISGKIRRVEIRKKDNADK